MFSFNHFGFIYNKLISQRNYAYLWYFKQQKTDDILKIPGLVREFVSNNFKDHILDLQHDYQLSYFIFWNKS